MSLLLNFFKIPQTRLPGFLLLGTQSNFPWRFYGIRKPRIPDNPRESSFTLELVAAIFNSESMVTIFTSLLAFSTISSLGGERSCGNVDEVAHLPPQLQSVHGFTPRCSVYLSPSLSTQEVTIDTNFINLIRTWTFGMQKRLQIRISPLRVSSSHLKPFTNKLL